MPTRFARKNFFPQGWQYTVAQFLELFHRFDYIFKNAGDSNWVSPKGNWRLDDSAILKAISLQNTKYFIGTRAGHKTRYAVIDIDFGSKYHNEIALAGLLETLTTAGLSKSSLYQSSLREGWHLYIFFDEPISSSALYQQLVRLLKLSKFDVAPGTLEVFPNPGYASVGMGLRLPMQAGFAWLDKKTLEVDYYREELSATKALELFVDALDSDANSYADFMQLKGRVSELEETRKQFGEQLADNIVSIRNASKLSASSDATMLVTSIFGHLPLNIDADIWQRGRQFYLEGLTEKAQRAKASFCVGHYFFYGDPSRNLPALGYNCEQERESLILDFLRSHHNGFSEEINSGRPGALSQVKRMANWLPYHKRNGEAKASMPVVPISWVKENAKRKAGARRRIQDALTALQIRKRPFSTVELQQASGCARDTLYKHADIWRHEYERLAEEAFAACPDDNNSLEDSMASTELIVSFAQKSQPSSSTALKKEISRSPILTKQVNFELSQKTSKETKAKEYLFLKTRDDSGQRWMDKAYSLTMQSPTELSVGELKSKVYDLTQFFRVVQYEENATTLLLYLQQVRRELANRYNGPQTLISKDADDPVDSS